MEIFIPGVDLPASDRPPLWIAFRDEEILLDGATVILESVEPLASQEGPPGPDAPPPRRLYLGTLGGRPLYVAEVPAGTQDPRFVSLRSALMAVGRDHFDLVSLASERLRFERTHRFCGRCAAPTVDKPGERAKTCPVCSLHIYPPVSPAVIVLVHDGPRLLLARRRKMPFFALVAGFVESGESLEHCLAREVAEEVGVRVAEPRYFGSQPWPFPHQIMVGFYARWAGGEVVPDGIEIDEARWFEVDQIPALPPPISIARAMIDAFVSGQRRGEPA